MTFSTFLIAMTIVGSVLLLFGWALARIAARQTPSLEFEELTRLQALKQLLERGE